MERYKNFLFDLGPIIRRRAIEAKVEKDSAAPGTEEHDYLSGRVMAFNEVLSIMQQQADGFEIPRSELRLDDLDPDRDLT